MPGKRRAPAKDGSDDDGGYVDEACHFGLGAPCVAACPLYVPDGNFVADGGDDEGYWDDDGNWVDKAAGPPRPAVEPAAPPPTGPPARREWAADDYPYDVGPWRWTEATVREGPAEAWFNRGLGWMYGYNHQEAIYCFERCLSEDPDCPLAHWCIAYSWGPNYNFAWPYLQQAELAQARKHQAQALAVAQAHGKPWELALCYALGLRYPQDEKGKDPDVWLAWSIAYSEAMCSLPDAYPEQVDLAVLAAESIMGITPWKLWDISKFVPVLQCGLVAALAYCLPHARIGFHARLRGEPAPPPAHVQMALDFLRRSGPHATTALCTLAPGTCHLWSDVPMHGLDIDDPFRAQDRIASAGLPPNPGMCHFYVHCLEMSPHPEKALRYGDIMASAFPCLGHLIHMGTHANILCGEYQQAFALNRRAAAVDEVFLRDVGTIGRKYTFYCVHNYHFAMYGAMFTGSYQDTIDSATAIWDLFTDQFLSYNGNMMQPFAETYKAVKFHGMVRFGRWKEILDHPLPVDADLHPATTATLHYARALAFALGRDDISSALHEKDLFQEASQRVPASWVLHNNKTSDLLAVSSKVLAGELAYAQGNGLTAIELLREAVSLEDALPYDEPWGVMQPTRHALGAILLEVSPSPSVPSPCGHAKEALTVYMQDLGLSPGCVPPSSPWVCILWLDTSF
eukprot:gene9012-1618_t